MKNATEWRQHLGELVREGARTYEENHYFEVPMTIPRARIMMLQAICFVKNRRRCWLSVLSNCPEEEVRRVILQHEYEEAIKDEFSEKGHLDLSRRQAMAVGLKEEETLNPEPLFTTQLAGYAWAWLAKESHWLKGLASLNITEWFNDNRLLGDLGGGASARRIKQWSKGIGFTVDKMPDFKAHNKADEAHGEQFLKVFEQFASRPEEEAMVIEGAKEGIRIHGFLREGVAQAMEKLS
jgi:pyrroloquinoline quinone (PQQ) biosynthesis protein C